MNTSSAQFILLAWLCGTAFLSAIIVKIIAHVGVMDLPVERSSHTIPTPKGGGIGIISAFLIGSIIIFPLFNQQYPFSIIALFITVAFLSIISWLDDIKQWNPIIKLVAQIIAACAITITIPSLSILQQYYYFLIPILIVFLVFITNAFNFMDGINGLAGGVAAITCMFIYFGTSIIALKFISLALFCGVIGFLPFNYPKAEIFMGDVGSQSCGLLLATFGLFPFNMMDNLYLTTIPKETYILFFVLFGMIYDVTFTLIRRFFQKESLLQAHRSHLYQIAHRCQIPAALITIIEWLFCIWGGCIVLFIPIHTITCFSLALILLVGPQFIWTIFIIYTAQKANIKKW